jgi:hypothetical protein
MIGLELQDLFGRPPPPRDGQGPGARSDKIATALTAGRCRAGVQPVQVPRGRGEQRGAQEVVGGASSVEPDGFAGFLRGGGGSSARKGVARFWWASGCVGCNATASRTVTALAGGVRNPCCVESTGIGLRRGRAEQPPVGESAARTGRPGDLRRTIDLRVGDS